MVKCEITSEEDWKRFLKWRLEVKWLKLNQDGLFITPAGNVVEVLLRVKKI